MTLNLGEAHTEGETKHVSAQLRTSSARTSKVIKDSESIETVVEIAGRGMLTLNVDSGGGYSLRARPERDATPTKNLLQSACYSPMAW
jgi:hypothetical protein